MFLMMYLFCESILAQETNEDIQNILSRIHIPGYATEMHVIYRDLSAISKVPTSPAELEQLHDIKFFIQGSELHYYHIRELRKALKNTKVKKSNNRGDMYWGVILFNRDQRVLSIYVDRAKHKGKYHGYINSVPVTFESDESDKGLRHWFYDNFFNSFQQPQLKTNSGEFRSPGYSKELEQRELSRLKQEFEKLETPAQEIEQRE
jgi:hypothetical protein